MLREHICVKEPSHPYTLQLKQYVAYTSHGTDQTENTIE